VSLGIEWDLDTVIAILSIVVPLVAFGWEFGVVGRKRLGYRVQMDTLATDTAHSPYAGVLRELHDDHGSTLTNPSFVLLRIENAGWQPIVESDYLTSESDKTGIRVTFAHRRVAGAVVTEPSQPELRDFFSEEVGGFGYGEENGHGLIRLPKVKLNRRAHYKVLAVLESTSGDQREDFPDPVFRADVSGGGNGRGLFARFVKFKMARTESHRFASRPGWVFITLLALGVLIQAGTLTLAPEPAPRDCVGGTLYLHGSTAFEPAVRQAAEAYTARCELADVSIPITEDTFRGSTEGLTDLDRAGRDAGVKPGDGLADHIAFSDGKALGNHPRLLSRPLAYLPYTLVVNEDAGVENLKREEIRAIYAGDIKRWSEVGGADLPVHLVSRHRGSGTRTALVERVLGGAEPVAPTVSDCTALTAAAWGACEVGTTGTLLDMTAGVPGALGHSEVSSAERQDGVVMLRIDDQEPSLTGVEEGDYPYWQTEYAYTYGRAPDGSLAQAFLSFLTVEAGRETLGSSARLCSEVDKPGLCEPG
jgi:ABC-type phosphate transport system substrate-binding protein